MTALVVDRWQRRGACPGLSAPMLTGDGLLVRLRPSGTVTLDAFAGLCVAARRYGNGVVEITARGSIQIRGLTSASAPRFADAVATLGIAAEDGLPIIANALAGLDPGELLDASLVAAELRDALKQTSLAAGLAPKVSVVIDGGGTLRLDDVSADVRLHADQINGKVAFRVGVGGDGASARELGVVAAPHGVEAAMRLLDIVAQRGCDARARDVLAAEGIGVFRHALSWCQASTSAAQTGIKDGEGQHKPGHDGAGACNDVIGPHRLRDGSLAYGVGLAFGHAEAAALEQLTAIAGSAGATGMRAAPGRAFVIIGLAKETVPPFAAEAERLGFSVRHDDPRRRVVACAGAPVCSSAYIPARAMAPRVAAIVSPLAGASFTLHISGCAKGCAHPAPAALTVVGAPQACALVADGRACDKPFTVVPTSEVMSAIAASFQPREHDHV